MPPLSPPQRLLSPPPSPPTAKAAPGIVDLAIVGLSITPPGFGDSLVQPPPHAASEAAAARRVAALLRLAITAAACFLQQQLGLSYALPSVKRMWQTPGGRLAVHIQLPTHLAAQALARKRHRLHGTPYTVDLLRTQCELAVQKMERAQQRRQQSGASDAPVGPQQAVAFDERVCKFLCAFGWLLLTFTLVIIILSCLILVHFFPP